MCAALFGLMLVCSTMIFLFFSASSASLRSVLFRLSSPLSSLTPSQNAARSKYAFKYPPPATSTRAIPAILPNPFAISCAICRGVLFSRFANSKHTGEAACPISIFGGRSSTIASSTPYFSRMCPASASRNRFVSVWYTCPLLECGSFPRPCRGLPAAFAAVARNRAMALDAVFPASISKLLSIGDAPDRGQRYRETPEGPHISQPLPFSRRLCDSVACPFNPSFPSPFRVLVLHRNGH